MAEYVSTYTGEGDLTVRKSQVEQRNGGYGSWSGPQKANEQSSSRRPNTAQGIGQRDHQDGKSYGWRGFQGRMASGAAAKLMEQ